MAKADQIKEKLLNAESLEGVAELFTVMGFESEMDEGLLQVPISVKSLLEVYVFEERTEIDRRAREIHGVLFCQLAISKDFETWYFVRWGLKDKIRLLKYKFQKSHIREAENPVAIQRLVALKLDKEETFRKLF